MAQRFYRRAALGALLRVAEDRQELLPDLMEALKTNYIVFQKRVVEALHEIGAPLGRGGARLVHGDDVDLRAAFAEALGEHLASDEGARHVGETDRIARQRRREDARVIAASPLGGRDAEHAASEAEDRRARMEDVVDDVRREAEQKSADDESARAPADPSPPRKGHAGAGTHRQ